MLYVIYIIFCLAEFAVASAASDRTAAIAAVEAVTSDYCQVALPQLASWSWVGEDFQSVQRGVEVPDFACTD